MISRSEWRRAVADDETVLGYVDWVTAALLEEDAEDGQPITVAVFIENGVPVESRTSLANPAGVRLLIIQRDDSDEGTVKEDTDAFTAHARGACPTVIDWNPTEEPPAEGLTMSDTTTTRSEAYHTGYEARVQGEPKSANPYPAGSWDADQWIAGWNDAK